MIRTQRSRDKQESRNGTEWSTVTERKRRKLQKNRNKSIKSIKRETSSVIRLIRGGRVAMAEGRLGVRNGGERERKPSAVGVLYIFRVIELQQQKLCV